MILEQLRQDVLEANLELVRRGLVLYTFGNASGISRPDGLVAIKPSGVPFEDLTPADIVVTDLDGRLVEGRWKPSSDLATHLALYKGFASVGGVVHTHSSAATAWAQAGREIPCFGTTHADYFHGPVPVTAPLTHEEIAGDYEFHTGQAILRRFADLDPARAPGVLVASHGPFCWGPAPAQAAMNAVLLEEIARIALMTVGIDKSARAISQPLLDRHFLRKHGPGATYGQR
jgi:L-ribulose-5-phosphate 4-epimerase